MRRILPLASAVLAGMGLLGWGIPAGAAAKSPDELKRDQMAQAASSPSTTGGAQAASSPSSTSGAAASSSPSTSSGATAASSPSTSSGATAAGSPSTTGAATASSPSAGTSGAQQVTDQELQQHARAHAALEQKAPDAFTQLKTSKDPAADVKASDRQKIEQALQGTGLSFDEFARVHQQVVTDPQVRSRFAQIAKQSKAQAGATQSPASTSGAAASSSPSGTTSGAASSGAQPSSSPN
jgi:hypothetical protein